MWIVNISCWWWWWLYLHTILADILYISCSFCCWWWWSRWWRWHLYSSTIYFIVLFNTSWAFKLFENLILRYWCLLWWWGWASIAVITLHKFGYQTNQLFLFKWLHIWKKGDWCWNYNWLWMVCWWRFWLCWRCIIFVYKSWLNLSH